IPGVVAPPAGLGGQDGNATPGGFGNVTGGFNVNGQRNQSNNFLLDGASNNDSFNTGFVLRPPPDAIQEFKILTHAYDAEYGRDGHANGAVSGRARGRLFGWRGDPRSAHGAAVSRQRHPVRSHQPDIDEDPRSIHPAAEHHPQSRGPIAQCRGQPPAVRDARRLSAEREAQPAGPLHDRSYPQRQPAPRVELLAGWKYLDRDAA